jgi:hypothetical protein
MRRKVARRANGPIGENEEALESDPKEGTSKLMNQPMNAPGHIPKNLPAALLLALALTAAPAIHAAPQHTTALQPANTAPHRTRLILKDGSYQIVMSYRIVGNLVRYVSAERGGAEEEIPVSLVDFTPRPRPPILTTRKPPPSTPSSSRRRPTAPPSPPRSPKTSASPKRTAPSPSTPSAAPPNSSPSPRPTAVSTATPAKTS